MNRKIFIYTFIISIFLLFISFINYEQTKYYYAFNEKVMLISNPNIVLVKYTEEIKSTEIITDMFNLLSADFNWKWHDSLTVEISTNSAKSAKQLFDKLNEDEKVYSLQPLYTLKDGLEMGVTDEILVKFKSEVTKKQKEELERTFSTTVIKTTKIYQKLKIAKGEDALEIANKYYESGMAEFATPNFISYAELHQVIPNDPYFNQQIALHNIGQVFTDGHSGSNNADIDAPEAWEITTGSNNIIVAVLDEGVTSNHPDLPNSRQVRLNGSNFGDGNTNNPSPTSNNNHGNACAGIIGATMNNNEGIAGIAPKSKIMPIRIFNDNGTGVSPSLIADAIELAVDNGAHILSNSWGYSSSNQNLHPVIVAAINFTLNNNRIIIFAAGNTANHASNNDGYVSFPANVNIPGVLAVGASDRYDNQANYSPTSSLIDIVAPSHRAYPNQIIGETLEMWSIDIPGNMGYNPWPSSGINPPSTGETLPNTGINNLAYTARFGGTSHSCPVVAGVAALILSVNPDLSYMEVFNILTSTADKVGSYTYSNGKSNQMGYGRVNAFSAVTAAVSYQLTISGPSTLCSQGIYTVDDLPSGATVTWQAGSGLTVTTSQNTATVSATGTGFSSWIKAQVTIGSTSFSLPQKDIWVGKPVTSISGPQHLPNGGYATYSAYSNNLENVSYQWTITPSVPFTANGPNMDVIFPYGNADYAIKLTSTNNCGSSVAYHYVATGAYEPDRVYPNPSSDIVHINLHQTSDKSTAVQLKAEDLVLGELYDYAGNMVTRVNIVNGRGSLSVKHLSKGAYILKININGRAESHRIIVK